MSASPPLYQPGCATPAPWTISDVRSVEGEYLIVGGAGQDFGLIASVPEKADAELIVALRSRVEELTKALEKSLKIGRLLLQNSIGCAVNHYGSDREIHGLPGWLADTEKHLVECASALSLEGRGGAT